MKLVVTGDREVVSSDSLVLAVKKVDGTKFPPATVDIYSTGDVQVTLSGGGGPGADPSKRMSGVFLRPVRGPEPLQIREARLCSGVCAPARLPELRPESGAAAAGQPGPVQLLHQTFPVPGRSPVGPSFCSSSSFPPLYCRTQRWTTKPWWVQFWAPAWPICRSAT